MVDFILETIDCPPWNSPCEFNFTECCVDATSHNFTWQFDTLGVYPSEFKDVSIVDENHAWAVGDITIPDTSYYSGFATYNVAFWNGIEWKLDRVLFIGWGGNETYGNAHWDGDTRFSEFMPNNPGLAYDIWGSSPDDIWFVGSYGNFTHYEYYGYTINDSLNLVYYSFNYSETSIEAETGIRDIWGIDSDHIWAVANDAAFGCDYILKYDPIEDYWNDIYWHCGMFPEFDPDTVSGYLSATWAYGDTVYFACESGIAKESISTGEQKLMKVNDYDLPISSTHHRLRGNHYNDILSVASNTKYSHYNGKSWYTDLSIYDQTSSYTGFRGVDYSGRLAIFVGRLNGYQHGFLVTGKRDNINE